MSQRLGLEVEERGTVAVAYMMWVAIGDDGGGEVGSGGGRPPMVRADRPFLFFVLEERTRAILFLGRVTEPVPPEAL